jgi:hypothetical protein
MMSKRERLGEFFKRMAAAPAASTAVEAFILVNTTMEAVESELAGADDDHMQGPNGDFYFAVDGRPDLDLYRHAAHDTVIRDNGAILFRIRKTRAVIFEKAGADGRKVDL